MRSIEGLDPKEWILIKGAKTNNLNDIDIAIPTKKLVVITGVSGSGKSSLAFDTLYAEGQRRYVESLSSYARQFLGKMSKPPVDYIKGLSPAIAIEQRVNTRNPRSTVGTSTEIYEYIKLLFARIGKTYSPVSGSLVKRDTVSDVVDYITTLPTSSRVLIIAPHKVNATRKFDEDLAVLLQQGFTRILYNDEIMSIEAVIKGEIKIKKSKVLDIIVDRIVVDGADTSQTGRIADSVETAFYEGGTAVVVIMSTTSTIQGFSRMEFSNKFSVDGIDFEEPSVNLFTFNNPYGACKMCEGFGTVIGIDPDLVVPDKNKSIYEEAVVCWKGEKMSEYKTHFINNAWKTKFPVHTPYCDLSKKELDTLWNGNESKGVLGINDFFKMVESNQYKIQYRVMLSRYRGRRVCPECNGARLRPDAMYVKIDGYSIADIVFMQIDQLISFFNSIELSEHDKSVSKRIFTEIRTRLQFLSDVGLGYLTLNRGSNTLSGGESQRINLSTSLGSTLVGSIYILDEPSIGLHSRDTNRLIKVLKRLRDLGNTVVVVEHDEEIIRSADYVIDIGPDAGRNGGNLVFSGTVDEMMKNPKVSYTAQYLSGQLSIPTPITKRSSKFSITIEGARENNLKNITVNFPLNVMTVVTGVSGSGKTTLIKRILYPALAKKLGLSGNIDKIGAHARISGDIQRIENIEMVDQNPIGRSSRSNPATYIGAWDDVRVLYADQPLSKTRGYKQGFFSFNVPGGRCDECEGEGVIKVEMQFMADIYLPCESCHGTRFKEELLDVKFNGKSVADLLVMTIDEAIDFFTKSSSNNTTNRIVSKLKHLQDVGLGYLQLGQSSSTLSGGEAQRVKLAHFLSQGSSGNKTLFIFDEPTTGLHFHDIGKLLDAFNSLIDIGHTVIVIEHNNDVIKSADYIVNLGPEGGDEGGYLIKNEME